MPDKSLRFVVHDSVYAQPTFRFSRMRPLRSPLPPFKLKWSVTEYRTTPHSIYVSDATQRIVRAVHNLVTNEIFELADIRDPHFVSPMQDATGVIASTIALVHRLAYPGWYEAVDADAGEDKKPAAPEERLLTFLDSIGYRVELAACLLLVYKYRVETEPLLPRMQFAHGVEVGLLPALSVLSRFLDERHFPCTWERGNLPRHPLETRLLEAEARILAIDCLHRTIVFNPLAIVQDSFYASLVFHKQDIAYVLQDELQPFRPVDMPAVLSVAAFYQIASALDARSGLYADPRPLDRTTGADAMYAASLLFIARTSIQGVPSPEYQLTPLETTLVPTIEAILSSARSPATNLVLKESQCVYSAGTRMGSLVDAQFVDALLRWLSLHNNPNPSDIAGIAEQYVAVAARQPNSTSSR